MKKIGILTYHCVPNFGAQLQVLSTVGYLQNQGYDPVVLNWYPKDLEEHYEKRSSQYQRDLQYDFAHNNLPLSNLCRTIGDLCVEIERLGIEAVFLGSDALFDYTPEKYRYNFSLKKFKKFPIQISSNHLLPNPFWGSFNDFMTKEIPLYGYAISSQNMPFSDLNKKEKKELKRLLNRFKILSVRDEWTKAMVEKVAHRNDITITPDPVFALNKNFKMIPERYEILSKFKLPENYVLISFVYNILSDDYINNLIESIEHLTGYYCISFPMPDKLRKFNTNYAIDLPLDPIDWYALIKYSKGYIGERMHPIISCLSNGVPFFCFDQYGTSKTIIPRIWKQYLPKSSKIYDILKQADLLNCMTSYYSKDIISVNEAVSNFLKFPVSNSIKFAEKQLCLYNKEMKNLLNHIG